MAQVFGAPLEDAAALVGSDAPASRTHLAGIVLGTSDEGVHLRSGETAFIAGQLAPYISTQSAPHPLELIPPARQLELKPGDHVELVASALRTKPWLELSFASINVPMSGALPPARPVEGSALLTSAVGDLVRVRGEVRAYTSAAGSAGIVETLNLIAGEVPLHARVESAQGRQLASYNKGDVLELTGLLLPPSDKTTARLVITGTPERGTPTVAVVSRNWSPTAMRTIGILGTGLVAALAVAWWLRRQVGLRTAALATANAKLQAEAEALEQTRTELARALEQERELGELKSRFVNMVNHELRTPLGITMSAVELLQHYHERLPQDRRDELLGDIHRSTKTMAGIMEEVLLLGRVEAGKLGYKPEPIDFPQLAAKLTDESLSATNRRCPITWIAENDLSGATGDEALLRHIFQNLLSNAVKYSPENSPVEFRARREGTHAIVTIRDHGIGIPREEIPRMFEAFHRCPNVGDIPGTGLGLVIVKRCIDLHHGTITLVSELGRGTTWTVRLPLW